MLTKPRIKEKLLYVYDCGCDFIKKKKKKKKLVEIGDDKNKKGCKKMLKKKEKEKGRNIIYEKLGN